MKTHIKNLKGLNDIANEDMAAILFRDLAPFVVTLSSKDESTSSEAKVQIDTSAGEVIAITTIVLQAPIGNMIVARLYDKNAKLISEDKTIAKQMPKHGLQVGDSITVSWPIRLQV